MPKYIKLFEEYTNPLSDLNFITLNDNEIKYLSAKLGNNFVVNSNHKYNKYFSLYDIDIRKTNIDEYLILSNKIYCHGLKSLINVVTKMKQYSDAIITNFIDYVFDNMIITQKRKNKYKFKYVLHTLNDIPILYVDEFNSVNFNNNFFSEFLFINREAILYKMKKIIDSKYKDKILFDKKNSNYQLSYSAFEYTKSNIENINDLRIEWNVPSFKTMNEYANQEITPFNLNDNEIKYLDAKAGANFYYESNSSFALYGYRIIKDSNYSYYIKILDLYASSLKSLLEATKEMHEFSLKHGEEILKRLFENRVNTSLSTEDKLILKKKYSKFDRFETDGLIIGFILNHEVAIDCDTIMKITLLNIPDILDLSKKILFNSDTAINKIDIYNLSVNDYRPNTNNIIKKIQQEMNLNCMKNLNI